MFVLGHKIDVVIRIKQLRALIERNTGKTIKHIQTNNTMEFYPKLLNEFYMIEGIVRHCISANEPQQVIELMSNKLLKTTHKNAL